MPNSLLRFFARFLPLVLLAASLTACGGQSSYPLLYGEEVGEWADTYGLDPLLVYAVIHTESGFDPEAASDAGAIGLMQMTEDTFDWVKSKVAPEDETLTFESLYQPAVSIRFGCYFLAYCMEKYVGDVSTAAAAYHSGMGTVDRLLQEGEHTADGRTLSSFPYRQMSHYVKKINDSYRRYQELYAATSAVGAKL